MNWTKEQKQVIELRNCNILVSAAAGSGKTAVLIERILSRITDPEDPVNVDEFLIVTFTRAAAAQMKEKLLRALEKALAQDPDNEHLQKQIVLVPMAQISTIHSFCGYVIQNYFHRTGIDPAYRVGTESELGMIRADVLGEMLEEKYESPSDEFLQVAQMSRFVKSDKEIEEIILYLYSKAVSEPFPQKFFEKMERFVNIDTLEDLQSSEFVHKNTQYVKNMLFSIRKEYDTMLSICESPMGPEMYVDFLMREAQQFENVPEEADLEQLRRWLDGIVFDRLPGRRKVECDEDKKASVQALRNEVKDSVKKMKEGMFDCSLEEQLEQLRQMRGSVCTFLHLTAEFMERYRAVKREHALVDFNDLEQMAMEILLEEDEDGEIHPTDAARELAEQFTEIMIDEYQDSNRTQDILLSSVASGRNMFMVGDIKQSIYRFRMACPDLFLEKLHRYSQEDGDPDRLVCLNQNFRSREVVLEGANRVFEQIMRPELGGVGYDEQARLKPGAEFADCGERLSQSVDVYAINGKDDGSGEGRLIANLIHDYMDSDHPLYVKDDEGYRPVTFGDIVILARSTKRIGQEIYDVLAADGIPVHMEKTSGFFETREISLMVSLLQIIDNPRQDIPLVAVLRSPVFDFSDDELALVRGKTKNLDFYDSILFYQESDEADEQLQQKMGRFLEVLNDFREKMTYVTVADMIEEIYDRTKLDYFMEAMKNGGQRKANLEMLLEVARDFDRISYKGLHQFVRYLSGIKEREEDLGEASLSGEGDNAVRIMTIHKSKGLEFPVCIVAGMGKKMAAVPAKSFLIANPEIGVAMPIVDNEKGTSTSNTFLRSLMKMNELEDLGEELRVLYVAMTRAKEKLVFTGCADPNKCFSGNSYFQLIRAKTYYDWVLPAIEGSDRFCVNWVEPEELEKEEVRRQAEGIVDEVMLNNFDTNITYDKEIQEMFRFMEEHPVEKECEVPTKVSVSEIKKQSMEENAEEDFHVLDENALENQSPVPRFASEDQTENVLLSGANYGTAWHQVMAALSLEQIPSRSELEDELEQMVASGRIKEENRRFIRVHKLMRFMESPIGGEMMEAKRRNKLYREQPFVTRIPAAELVEEADETEYVLVQGIIDVFFETEQGIVLLDYKTDRLSPGEEEVLVERYKKQMELYAYALEKIFGKPVVKKVLYSFSLDEEIEIKG